MDIQVLKVDSPGSFKAREIPGSQMSSDMQEFQRMDQEIQNICNSSQYVDIHVLSPLKGQMYLVKRKEGHESHWYRCTVETVLRTTSGSKSCCYLVDRADTILVPHSQMREIPDHFRKIPPQVQEFTLHCIQPITMSVSFIDGAEMRPTVKYDTAAVEYFGKLIKGKPLQCHVKHIDADQVKHVTLFAKHQGELLNVNDILVEKMFAKRLNDIPEATVSCEEMPLAPSPDNSESASHKPAEGGVEPPTRIPSKPAISPIERLKRLQNSLERSSEGGARTGLGLTPLSGLGIPRMGQFPKTEWQSDQSDGNMSESSTEKPQARSANTMSGSEEGYSSQDDPIRTSSIPAGVSSTSGLPEQRAPFLLSSTKVQASLSKQLLSIKEKTATSASATPAPILRKVLIHGERPPKLILDVKCSPFPEKLKHCLSKFGYTGVTLVQSACWPAISRGRDIMAVSPKDQNIAFAYLVPVISEMMQSSYTELPAGHGPTSLVITSSWQKALSIYQQCLCLNANNTNDRLRAILLHRGGSEEEQKIQLVNGAPIVIGTLPCILRLVVSNHVNLNRLFHLVIDDADNVFEHHLEATKEFMVKFRTILRVTPKRNSLRQLMVFSNKWTIAMGSYLRTYLTDPLLIITDCLEMAVYSRVHQKAVLIHPSKRVNILLEKLTSGLNETGKVMVFTSTKETARDIRKILKCSSCFTLLAAGEMLSHQLEDLRYEWQTGHRSDSQPVLVVSDDCVEDLELQDASCIIHYDLPSSKVKYGKRMACLKETFVSQLEESKTADCQVITLVTPDNNHHLYSLLHIMERSGQPMPDGVTLKKAIEYREERHSTRPLCHFIKSFGFCRQDASCAGRHLIIPREDMPGVNPHYMTLPQRGQVKILVMHVIDAISFFARIMRYQPSVKEGTVPITQLGGNPQLNVQLSLWYSDPERCTEVTQPVFGKLYATRDNKKSIHRVLLEKSVKNDDDDGERLLLVKFVDEGKRDTIPSYNLLALPKAFKNIPYQAVEIICCGAMPPDKENQWTTQANLAIHNMIHGEELEGKIVMSLGNTLWLDPVVQRIKVPDLKTHINRFNVRLELIEKDFAVPNPTHLEKIKELCSGKIDLDTDEHFQRKKQEAKELSLKPQYECLPIGKSRQVYLSAAGSPHQFSVQKVENSDQLENLMTEINKDEMLESRIEEEGCKEWAVGDLCLAKFQSDDRWYRGKVAELGENLEVVFLDHGDQESVPRTELRPMPRYLLEMPFAAIDCTMNHVTPQDGGDIWSPDVADELWSMCNEGADRKAVTIHVISDEENTDEVGCDRRYNVELFLFIEGRKVALSQVLAKEGKVVLCREKLAKILLPTLHLKELRNEASTLRMAIAKQCQQILLSQDVKAPSLLCQELYQQIQETRVLPKNCNISQLSHDIITCLCRLLNHHEAIADKSRVMVTEGLLTVVNTEWSNALLVVEEGCIPSLCMTLQQIVDSDIRQSIFWLLNIFPTKKLLSFPTFLNVLFGVFISVPSPEIQICCLKLFIKLWQKEKIKTHLLLPELVRAICNILWGNPTEVLICESTKMLQLLTGEDEVVSVMRKEKLGNCLECLSMAKYISVDSEAYRLIMSLSNMFDPDSDLNLFDSQDESFEVIGVIPFVKPNSDVDEDENDEGTSVDGPLLLAPSKDHLIKEEAGESIDEGTSDVFFLTEKLPPPLVDDDLKIYHPRVQWSQRSNSVTISVQLRGVQSFILEVTSLSVKFSTFHDDKQYEFDVQLCHRVGPNNYISKSLGSEVLVTLFKEGVGVNWPRLTGSKVKLPYLSIDCERWKEEDDYGYDSEAISLPENKNSGISSKQFENATIPELDESSVSSSLDEDDSSCRRSDSSSSSMGFGRGFLQEEQGEDYSEE
ncbi:putative ATP-dependent RNA helicase TDRD12 isoform X2 [Apostichopus japonicus]